MTERAWVAVVGLAIAIAPGAIARADSAPPEPADLDCPRGTVATLPEVDPDALDPRGRPVRPYPYCAPTRCTSDADCDGGRTCSEEEIGLCLEEREVPGGEPVQAPRSRGCEPDGTCLNVHATCDRSRRCVEGPAEAAPGEAPAAEADGPEAEVVEAVDEVAEDTQEPAAAPAAASDGCGCRAAPGRALPFAALLAPLALLARRRRG